MLFFSFSKLSRSTSQWHRSTLIFSPFCHYNALSAVPETARDHLGQAFVQQAQRIPWPVRCDATALMLWRWYRVIVRQLLPKLKVTTNFIMAMACYDMLWMAMICKCRQYGEKSCGVCRWVYLCCADIERYHDILRVDWVAYLSTHDVHKSAACMSLRFQVSSWKEPLRKSQKKGFQSKTILGTRSVKQETADPQTNHFTGEPSTSRINVDQWIQPVNPSEAVAEIVSMSKVHWDRSWRFIHCWELLRTVQNAQVLKFLETEFLGQWIAVPWNPEAEEENPGNGPCHHPKKHVWNWS